MLADIFFPKHRTHTLLNLKFPVLNLKFPVQQEMPTFRESPRSSAKEAIPCSFDVGPGIVNDDDDGDDLGVQVCLRTVVVFVEVLVLQRCCSQCPPGAEIGTITCIPYKHCKSQQFNSYAFPSRACEAGSRVTYIRAELSHQVREP